MTQSGHFAKPVAYPGVDEWLAQLKSATNRWAASSDNNTDTLI